MVELSGLLSIEGFRGKEELFKWAADTFSSEQGKLFLSALRNQALIMTVKEPTGSEGAGFYLGRAVGRVEMLDYILMCAIPVKKISDVEPTYETD